MVYRIILQAIVLALAAGFSCEAKSDTTRPVCDGGQAGRIWSSSVKPEGKNREGNQSGDLQVCARGVYRYHWQALTVSYQELLRAAQSKGHAGNFR